ncbi:hypothetical protein MJO28_015376 [Puccinia striiformis f. sp. tritici]|uniref:Uncharacterized protein n=1 Tax=Puccinia striiformis f. sp. tritici TaxID=168172 RepID=A0ACC0DTL5_9BASI|nr:hypothetical protein MJO28_015376 [Puccinia striiformis f. sp. tritici]
MAFQGVIVRSPQENNEVFLMENFGVDIPNNVGNCNNACKECVSAHFQRFVQSYNNALSFASMGAELDRSVQGSSPASFAQIYVVGGNDVDEAMLQQVQSRAEINHDMLLHLQNWLTKNNLYARWYQSVQQHLETNTTSQLYLRSLHDQCFVSQVFNCPTVEEVGMVIDWPQEDVIAPQDILLHRHSGAWECITNKFTGYLPLRFPVFFLFGKQGWIMNWHRGAEDCKLGIFVADFYSKTSISPSLLTVSIPMIISTCEWYAAMIFDHCGRFSVILHGRALFHKLLVNLYICVERNQLDYLRFHQRKIKANLCMGLAESLRNNRDPEGMVQLFQDAMAIVREFGRPSLFITITANTQWPDILAQLEPNQVAVFQLKLKSILDDLTGQHCLGLVVAFIYTIKFQKRGLPHAHLMLVMDPAHVPRTVDAVDSLICAELPDPILEPTLFQIVTRCMLHSPCNQLKPCWRNKSCKENFLRAFKPYNCHINVKIAIGIAAVKYLFKYITKGMD